MKKFLTFSLLLLLAVSCKKSGFSPEGPTDIRIRNLSSDLTFSEVIVNTTIEADTLGDIAPGNVSEYVRFKKAYPKAEITAKINGQVFTTGPVSSTYMQYIGRDRITYEVYISNMTSRELVINNVVVEEPLVLKK